MSEISPLNRAYVELLRTAGCSVTTDGMIKCCSMPMMIDTLPGALPLPERLADPGVNIFHPAREAVNLGESETIRALRRAYTIRFNSITASLLLICVKQAILVKFNPDLPPTTNIAMQEAISLLSDVDATMGDNIAKMMEQVIASQSLINISLKRGGTVDGQKVHRTATIRFEIPEAGPVKDKDQEKKVTLRKKDSKAVADLMHLFFGINDAKIGRTISFGSRSASPYLDSLIQAAKYLTECLTNFLDGIEDFDPEAIDLLKIKGEFDLDMAGLRQEIESIPIQTTSGKKPGAIAQPSLPANPQTSSYTPKNNGESPPPMASTMTSPYQPTQHQPMPYQQPQQPNPPSQPYQPPSGYPPPQPIYPQGSYPPPQPVYPQAGYHHPQPVQQPAPQAPSPAGDEYQKWAARHAGILRPAGYPAYPQPQPGYYPPPPVPPTHPQPGYYPPGYPQPGYPSNYPQPGYYPPSRPPYV